MPLTRVLKAEGKIVTIKLFKEGLRMCAIDSSAENVADYKAEISERRIGRERAMALLFRRGTTYYRIKVAEKTLLVEQAAGFQDPIPDDYWFVRKNNGGGKNYSLRPLVDQDCCLSVRQIRPYNVILSDRLQESAQVTDEKI